MSVLQLIHPGNNLDNVIADIPGILGYYPTKTYSIISISDEGYMQGHATLDYEATAPDRQDETLAVLKEAFAPQDDTVYIIVHPRGEEDSDFAKESQIFYDKLLDSYIPIGAIITVGAIEEDEAYSCYKQGDARYVDIPRAEGVNVKFDGVIPPIHTMPSVKERLTKSFPIYQDYEEMMDSLPTISNPTKSQKLSNELNHRIWNIRTNTDSATDTLDLAYMVAVFANEYMNHDSYDPHIDVLFEGDNVEEINIIAALLTILNPMLAINEHATALPAAILFDTHENLGILLDKALSFKIDINIPTRLCAQMLRSICYLLDGDISMAQACADHIYNALEYFDCEYILEASPYLYFYKVLAADDMDDEQKNRAINALVGEATNTFNEGWEQRDKQ